MALTIDRMEIDDAGQDPEKLAISITKQIPENGKSIPVREISTAIGIYEIREEILDGLEGALIAPESKSEGAILVHSERQESRKRFTIAHEIGHYVNPTHRSSSPDGFRCSSTDMKISSFKPGDRHAKMEMEANQFAIKLLLPESRVRAFLRNRPGIDLEHILAISDSFEVSREATARRYIERLDEPVAVVFSQNGKIRYIIRNGSFPRLSVWNGAAIPSDCLSSKSNKEIGEVTEVVETIGHLWLAKSADISLGEQTVLQREGFRMTLLTIEETGSDETQWEAPSFKR